MKQIRTSGILLHPTSFPGPDGIGDLGPQAYAWIDFLESSGCTIWQTLPLGPTGYGDSPYQCFSACAGNPLLVSPTLLLDEGYLSPEDFYDRPAFPLHQVDFGPAIEWKQKIMSRAYQNFTAKGGLQTPEYITFCEENARWLNDFALFMAIKNDNGGVAWQYWPEGLKKRDKKAINAFSVANSAEINFYKFLQFYFFKQWNNLMNYAHEKGIKIVGDIPIFVSMDSSDVWSNPDLFYLDGEGNPTVVAGVPPDYFSPTGQLWGNPLYNYDYIKKDNYKYFINKFSHLLNLYDVLRIDHFRGFDSYYAIPHGSPDATGGKWVKGPGIELFNEIKKSLGDVNIVVEDLGFLTDSVRNLLKETGFPGMKVMEFAFNAYDKGNTEYLPHTYPENSVAYLGTHDNDTFMGWINSIRKEDRDYAIEYLKLKEPSEYYKEALQVLYNSKSNLVVVQFQDILGTGSIGRINAPATLSEMNWSYRLLPYELDDNAKTFLKNLTVHSNRG